MTTNHLSISSKNLMGSTNNLNLMRDNYIMFIDSLYFNYMFYSFFAFFIYQSYLASGYFYLRYLRLEKKRRQIKQVESVESVVIKFEDKYLDQYKTLKPVFLSEDRLETLKNTLLFEGTPLGNLIMFYNHSRESFTYYSDNAIPYRFLEVASRHYVIQNNCKSIHINMLEELSEAENRLQEKKEKEKEKEPDKINSGEQPKKNVFAKLKNYNTASVRAPNATTQKLAPKNSRTMPNSNVKINNETSVIVKEKANRYSYEGKIANFSFLKKIESNITNKLYDMSFADFINMQKPCN